MATRVRKFAWMLGVVLASLATPVMSQTINGLDGDWDGVLTVPGGAKLRLALHVESPDGAQAAILTSVDQGNVKMPVTKISRDGAAVTLEIPAVHGSFKGTLSGDTFAGIWNQGAPLPLTFTRRMAGSAAPAPAALKRPQEPKPPFPYKSEDVTFAGAGDVKLAGTLTMPEGPGHFPRWCWCKARARMIATRT